MKKLILTLALAMSVGFGVNLAADVDDEYDYEEPQVEVAAVDTYTFTMRLAVPRIYDNAQSLGSRKYQSQTIKGEMLMMYGKDAKLVDVQFTNMVNKTHKLSNGKYVSYGRTTLDTIIWPRFNAIGSNKTGKFKTASICFYIAAEPSYNIGEFDEDNALYVMLAGKGTFHSKQLHLKSASGKVAGTLGCGCMAYGHKSPTRKITFYGPGKEVDDVAAVFGTWSIKYSKTKLLK